MSLRQMLPIYIALIAAAILPVRADAAVDAARIVEAAVNYWRDSSSYAEATMTVHRPDFERSMTLRSWTKGRDRSLIRFVAPPKDAGNASLTLHEEMWSYSPKINRVIKIPPSMVHQSWMGSDFSYNDLAKADDIIDRYDHRVIGEEDDGGKHVWIIESIPHEDAAVIWGKEVLKIRDDKIILQHDFFDQDGKAIKRMRALSIKPMDGKLYPVLMRMQNLEKDDQWTEISNSQVRFGQDFNDQFFSTGNLANVPAGAGK